MQLFLLLLSFLLSLSSSIVQLIIDTDLDFDVDDVGAVCVAHSMADKGEVEIIAIVHNAGYPKGIGAVSVLNHYYGRDEIPLGAFKGEFGAEIAGVYVDDLVDNWESPVKHYDQVEDAVKVLRAALAAAEDQSVVISSVGFLTNIANLLFSPGDNISESTGYDLVRDKVRLVAIMGGFYPSSNNYSSFNFNCGHQYSSGEPFMGEPKECGGKSQQAVLNMPKEVRVVFSGFEVGLEVQSGAALTRCAPESNPCRQAYIDFLGEEADRPSWDPLTTVYAVRGAAGVSCEEVGQGGRNEVREDGSNFWVEDDQDDSNQSYLLLMDAGAAGDAIDDLLCSPPASSSRDRY